MRMLMPWALLAGLLAACADDEAPGPGEAGGASGAAGSGGEAIAPDYKALSRLGGTATVFVTNHDAFAQAVPTLDPDREDAFFQGNAIFNRSWVTAPASVVDMDGLGPVFNATNCSACHFKDGRGRPPVKPDEKFLSMLIRLSVPGADAHGHPLPEPTYGGQLQGNSILGVEPEGLARVTYEEVAGSYPDGTAYSLRRPTYVIDDLAYGPMRADVMMSARVAPQMIGLGLLEAIPEATILGLADPDDRDGDGISGRPNRVWDEARGQHALGRFGWKANEPTVRQQVLGAFNGDMGITSPLFPKDHCTEAQASCLAAKDGGSPPGAPELRDSFADVVVSYSATLAVPAQRRWQDADVQRGRDLFARVGCGGCHTSELRTGPHEIPELGDQVIRPFTDLLLHDMGPELADNRPDFEASGSEWRTPPLWGVGLFKVVNRHTFYLHDGRARSLDEAILWHGGEGQRARDAFAALPSGDRDALLAFLGSL